MKHARLLLPAALVIVASGCASLVVTPDAITQRTATTLGVAPSQLTISERTNDNLRTDYTATTNAGKAYRCYVTGTFTVAGRDVSDAVCKAAGRGSGASASDSSSDKAECNALLKAAGKCN